MSTLVKTRRGSWRMNDATLLATVSLGGDFGLSGNVVAAEGGAVAGLIKAISIESW